MPAPQLLKGDLFSMIFPPFAPTIANQTNLWNGYIQAQNAFGDSEANVATKDAALATAQAALLKARMTIAASGLSVEDAMLALVAANKAVSQAQADSEAAHADANFKAAGVGAAVKAFINAFGSAADGAHDPIAPVGGGPAETITPNNQ